MQFVQEGDLFKVIHVTGPTHNYLGLMFGGQDGSDIDIDVMDIKPNEPKTLKADDVERQVREGVEAANVAMGTRYRVQRIQFVPSDSPPADIYRELAMKLVEHLAADGKFTPAGG